MSKLTLDAIKKMMEDICGQSKKRMVELINAKVTPTSSKPPDKTTLVDENGVPISEEGSHSREGSHSSEGSKKNEFGYAYNKPSNIQHPHVNNLVNMLVYEINQKTKVNAKKTCGIGSKTTMEHKKL